MAWGGGRSNNRSPAPLQVMNTTDSVEISSTPPDRCNSAEGEYRAECYTAPSASSFDPGEEVRRVQRLLKNQIAEATSDPLIPVVGRGPEVYVGLDCEWVADPERPGNIVLSAQYFLVGECGEHSRIIYTAGRSRSDRLKFGSLLATVLEEALENGIIREWPCKVVVCGFFLRADLAAFADLPRFKNKLASVGGGVASTKPIHFVFVERDND